MLIVFDIDGTLANIEHRLHHVRSKPKNWPAFDAGIPNDKVNEPVAAVFRELLSIRRFMILSWPVVAMSVVAKPPKIGSLQTV
jgi:hypothetical protein